jgi:hypothetical protein
MSYDRRPVGQSRHPGVGALSSRKPSRSCSANSATDVIKLASNENPRGSAVHANRACPRRCRAIRTAMIRLKQRLARHLGVAADDLARQRLERRSRTGRARCVVAGSEGIVSAHAFVVYPLAVIAHGGKLSRCRQRLDPRPRCDGARVTEKRGSCSSIRTTTGT